MLDALKNRGAGRKQTAVDEQNELIRLINIARAERAALDETLRTLRERSAVLAPIGSSLDQITDKVTDLTTLFEDVGERVVALDSRTSELEQLDGRIQSLKDAARQAEECVAAARSSNGELAKHREAVEQLSSQARQTQSTLETLRTEHTELERMRGQLRAAQTEIKQSADHVGALKSELEHIQRMTIGLTEDCALLAETSRQAREDTTSAMAAIKEVEKKLGPLAQLPELGQDTEERLVTLNALAERVALKAKAIENQQLKVEHALVQTNRVNEMVWSMEVQIGKLHEGMKHAASADETLARLEKVSADMTERLASAAKLHEQTEQQTAKLEKRRALLIESMSAQADTLAVGKQEVEAVDQRLRVLDGAVGRAEARLSAFAEQEKALSAMAQGVEGLSKRFKELFAQSDDLIRRQLKLDGLHARLAQVDDLSKKTSSQIEWIQQGRQDLDKLRHDVQAFHKSHAEMRQLAAELTADRQALEGFGERMTAISTRAPELEAKFDMILGKISVLEKATEKATWLERSMSEFDGQVSRLEARASVVEKIETRLNGLNTLSTEIDRRLEQQLALRHEFDKLQTASEGVMSQIVDAQHKLEALNAMQARFVPLVEQVRALKTDIDATQSRLGEIQPDNAVVAEQEARFAQLVATSRVLGTELAERAHSLQALADQLSRSDNLKTSLLSELEQVESRHRDTVVQIEDCLDQLALVEKTFKQLEERRVEITIGEQKLLAIEARLADIRQVSDELERSHDALASREELVRAVKAEVEAVHLISARSKADLDYVMQHRGDVSALRTQVEGLSSRVAETDQRVVSMDAHRKHLEEVENKANVILDLLDDVRINVEMIEEQKAVVDQVAQTVTELDFRLQEARSTLGTLQRERELAERLEQGIRQLRSKAARPEEVKTPV